MTPVQFNEFKQNVESWAEARGIYAHSTAVAQALKGVSETGELADAVVKGDHESLVDAIGDVMVCIVNAARMGNETLRIEDADEQYVTGDVPRAAAWVAYHVSGLAVEIGTPGGADTTLRQCVGALLDLCDAANLRLEDCCDAAWREIKDRTGRMVAGGAFVRD